MKPPPCIVSLRKKTRNLRRKRRQPYTAILVGAFLMRLESQAVKTRPKRKPLDIDRIKKGSRLESFMTKLTTIAKSKKPVSNVLVPIQPWRANRTTTSSSVSTTSSSSSSTSVNFSQQHAQPPAPIAASRTVKSELCPVTETCTAATMPPSSPSSSRHKNKQTPSHQKSGGVSHYRTDTLVNPSTPEGIRKSICSSPKPITPTIARIKTDPTNPNMHRNHHTSTSLISPDLQRVRVDIGHAPLLPHHGHLLPTMQAVSQHSKMETSNSPYRESNPFLSPRKRMLLDQETNGSPSKKHRLSTDSGGSGGSSEGVRSGMGSPLLSQHQRVGSPATGLSYGASPPRLPQGAQAKSSSFSIDSIMSSRTSQDERDNASNSVKSNPIRPVAVPASPMRINDIKRDHEREDVLHRSRSTSGSPPYTPIQSFQKASQAGVSPPPMTTPSVNVSITPYQNRGMDPSTPIDPRLAHLAGLIADPRLGLTPTRGAPFPYSPAIPGVPGLNPYYPYQLAAAASAAGLWTPPAASAVTTTIASNTSSPLDVGSPIRSTPSSLLQHDKPSTTTPQRRGSATFSPWGPQLSYRGEPGVSTPSSNSTISSRAVDLPKPDPITSGNNINMKIEQIF